MSKRNKEQVRLGLQGKALHELAHELKTPITSLSLKLQLANRILSDNGSTTSDWDRLKKYLGTADQDIKRLSEATEALLAGERYWRRDS